MQKIEHKRLGTLLIEHAIISESQLTDALSLQLDIPRILPSLELINLRLLQGLNPEELLQMLYLPVHRHEEQLTVVMADPLNQELIQNLEQHFRCQIMPAIAPASEIRHSLEILFKHRQSPQYLNLDSPQTAVLEDSTPEEDPTVTAVNFILASAVQDRAANIHVEPQERYLRIRFRVDGLLHHKTDLPTHVAPALIRYLKQLARLEAEDRPVSNHLSATLAGKEMDLRIASFPAQWGEKLVISLLEKHSNLLNLERIGFSPFHLRLCQQLLDQPGGLLLVTGPARSGRSTTLYAALNYLNDLDKALVTLENPILYPLPGVTQSRLHPDISAAELIQALVQQDPDVLMVPDLPDAAAARALIQAVVMGHKVLTSLHARDLTSALYHLTNLGIQPFEIAATVSGVISQRLLRTLCEVCKTPAPADPALLARFPLKPTDLQLFSFYEAVGCPECQFQGYRGRTALHEILIMQDSLRDALVSGQSLPVLRQLARRESLLLSFAEDGFYKAAQGLTSLQEVLRVAPLSESDRHTARSQEEVFALSHSRVSDLTAEILHGG